MFSVFFRMSEIISKILFGISERLFIKREKPFVEEYKLRINPLERGWMLTQTADRYFAEYRGKAIMFRPRLPVIHETNTIRRLPFTAGKREPEKVYVSWREVASEQFFKDVEELFKRVGGKGRKVAPATERRSS